MKYKIGDTVRIRAFTAAEMDDWQPKFLKEYRESRLRTYRIINIDPRHGASDGDVYHILDVNQDSRLFWEASDLIPVVTQHLDEDLFTV